MTDIPRIVAQRDDDAAYRRQRGDGNDARKQARPARPAGQVSSVSGAWRYVSVLALLVALAATAMAGLLYQQGLQLSAALEQSKLRISDLEGRLSSTDDSVNESSATMQVKIKDLAGEVDKLWASAWRKNDARITELDTALKKATDALAADRKQIATIGANLQKAQQQVAANQGVALMLETVKEQQATQASAIGRLSGTVNSLSNTQRAQEARLKESEQWVRSNIEFRKQVAQRLTRLENPSSALPSP
jgi:chromosome segregation ATPase